MQKGQSVWEQNMFYPLLKYQRNRVSLDGSFQSVNTLHLEGQDLSHSVWYGST